MSGEKTAGSLEPGGPELADVLLEVSPNGVLVTGADGRLLRVNPAALRLLPMVGDPVGRPVDDAVLVPAVAQALDPARDDRQEFAITVGNRELFVRAQALGPEQVPGGRGRLAIIEDITVLRRAERTRSEFVANVSHELRTPATSIAGYAETLLDDGERLPDDARRMVEVIHRNARRLTALFDDLLYLSRLDAREGPLPVTAVALEPVVAETLEKVAQAAAARDITLQTFGLPGVRVRANREALGHIVQNLVENAVKYSHDGGVVTVGARRRDDGWRLEVIDVGIGIDPALHDRIFERFYRVDKGRSRAAGGTGLGLAIVKRLCDKMGARVSVRSQLGSGTVFHVWMADPEPTDGEDPPAVGPVADGG
ncbi:MAG: PAS domain-containing protein [Deltaproteobacteria bacterium]|nr:MAG: PAS domain-containing protein [Deltaproteobacteria bacterium]